VGTQGYVHGDFDAGYRGPTRIELVQFGLHAKTLIEDLCKDLEKEGLQIEQALNVTQDAIKALV